ncbi:putative Zn-dependent protease with MMP-like domain [Pacificibacter maritimus]|uniref:Putative Zn-dependent protease with MMP-like domain n=1 Tax=Pacificibacter maritimus TaxID=762213 RepID=A0A3N4U9N7_9RHOB|nr:metallopeptidase family protein [Pacificibacter maritimus]RPE67443.1 putative Zn-dependent protease with MMP-like domain [Pacificibacter maritimus]
MPDALLNATAPDLDAIESIARMTIANLPAAHKVMAASVGINVMDFVPEDLMAEIGLEDPFALTGLYTGLPMPEKSSMDEAPSSDMIWLFRRPILDEWCLRGDVTLQQMVAHVTVHELAHHFGWSDEQIATIDTTWDYGL